MEQTAAVRRARRHTLGDLLWRTAARLPDKTGLVDGDLRLTYAELDDRVNRTANALAARGVGKGDRLALLSHNSHGFVVVFFACARLGTICVPVNFMLGPEEIAYILEHCEATAMVVEDALLPAAEAAIELAGGIGVRGVIGSAADGWETLDDWSAHGDAIPPEVELDDDDPLELLYTSGTESRPKGALLSHRSVIAQQVSCIVDGEMTADDVEVHALPLYHCAQLHCFLTPDIHLGATSVILPGADAAGILRAVEAEGATKLFSPPTVWISLLRHGDFDRRDLSSLRKGYYGASIMPLEVLAELRERLPHVRLFNFYGQTEMAPMAVVLRPEDQVRKAGSAGRAAINVETRVVGDDDRPLPPGEVGEIVHRSPHCMLGYWNDPEKTAEVFLNGWFHSGDLGVLDEEGYLTVVDRKKDMIKTGGESVASREVEEVIYRHPAVAEAAVFGVAHPEWIEAVTAAVVLREGGSATPEELIAHCRVHLAGFKAPKAVFLADALPKNPSGKILKRELRETYAASARP